MNVPRQDRPVVKLDEHREILEPCCILIERFYGEIKCLNRATIKSEIDG